VDKIKKNVMNWNVACTGEVQNANKSVVEESKGKGSLGRSRRTWEDKEVDLTEARPNHTN
jgi:hypothetical protein